MADFEPSILSGFGALAASEPDAPAIEVEGRWHTRGDLAARAAQVAGWLNRQGLGCGDTVALIGGRTFDHYGALMGCLWAGAAFVSLNPRHPENRLRRLIEQASPKAVLMDRVGEATALPTLSDALPPLRLRPADRLKEQGPVEPVAMKPDAPLYIVFTSGTTGTPKAIAPTTENARHFMAAMMDLFGYGPGDRVAQIFDTDFDPVLANVILPLSVGASVCIIPEDARLMPVKYLAAQGATVFYGAPSVVSTLARLKALRAGQLPALRLTLFGAEVLSAQVVNEWRCVAPSARIINYYGPSEATVACSGFEVPKGWTGEIPIGNAFPEVDMRLWDGNDWVCGAEPAEIVISGAQVIHAYFNGVTGGDVFFDQDGQRWYRTGDLGRRGRDGLLYFAGRRDHQVQLNGYRVETVEIERVIEALGPEISAAVVVGKREAGRVVELHVYVEGWAEDEAALRRRLALEIPQHALPARIFLTDALPRTVTGKIDRAGLARA